MAVIDPGVILQLLHDMQVRAMEAEKAAEQATARAERAEQRLAGREDAMPTPPS